MTTEQQKAKDQAAVMLAYADGKKIECKRKSSNHWVRINDCITPCWDWSDQDYRIAPEPEPCATPEMLAKLPGGEDKWERVREGCTKNGDWGIWVAGSMEVGNVECLDDWISSRDIKGYWESPNDGENIVVHVYRRKQEQPKMPSGVFWFRLSASCGNASLVTKIVAPYYLTLANNITYKLDDCVTFGYEYSYDRITWHKFGGEK